MSKVSSLNKFITVVNSVPLEIQQMIVEYSLRVIYWKGDLWYQFSDFYGRYSLKAFTSAEIHYDRLKIKSSFAHGVTVFSLEVTESKIQRPDTVKLIKAFKISKVAIIVHHQFVHDIARWSGFNLFKLKGVEVTFQYPFYYPDSFSSYGRLNENKFPGISSVSKQINSIKIDSRHAECFLEDHFMFQACLQCISLRVSYLTETLLLEKLVQRTKLLKLDYDSDCNSHDRIGMLNNFISKYRSKVELDSLRTPKVYNQEISQSISYVSPKGSLYTSKGLLQRQSPLHIEFITIDDPSSQLKNVVCSRLYAKSLSIEVKSIINCNFKNIHVRYFKVGGASVSGSFRKCKIDQKSIKTIPQTVTSLSLNCIVQLDSKASRGLISVPKYLNEFTCRLDNASNFNLKQCTGLASFKVVDVERTIDKSVWNNIPEDMEKLIIDASATSNSKCPDGKKFEIEMDYLASKIRDMELLTNKKIKHICVNMNLPDSLRVESGRWVRLNVSDPNKLNIILDPLSAPLFVVPINSLGLINIVDMYSQPVYSKEVKGSPWVHIFRVGRVKIGTHRVNFHFSCI